MAPTTTKTTTAAAASPTRVQKLILIRHGVAKHNLPDPVTGNRPNLHDPALFDPPLVYQGKQQALEAGEKLRTWLLRTTQGAIELPELVVASPLTRCLQTAMYACGPGDVYTTTRSSSSSIYYCTELCREAFGMHYPDRRRPRSVLEHHWPNFVMDPNMTENDDAWKPDSRETLQDVGKRVAQLLTSVVQRSETYVVVFSHGVFLETALNLHCPQALDHGRKRVYNCDVFCVDCVSTTKNGQFLRLDNPQKI